MSVAISLNFEFIKLKITLATLKHSLPLLRHSTKMFLTAFITMSLISLL